MKRLLLGIIAVIGAYVVAYPLFLSLIGYYPWGVSWEVAEKIVAKHGTAKDCLKIIHPIAEPMSPTEGEQRSSCIYDVAKLTKDPSACELLMPSSYGLSCVGAAEDSNLPCGSDGYTVYWSDKDEARQATLRECIKNNASYSDLGKQCCLVARTKYLMNENDCSSVKKETPIYDQCLYGLAWKNRNPDICYGITNANAKSACTVQAKALQNNPSICSGCTEPLNDIYDLK